MITTRMKSLLSARDLSREEIFTILDTADSFKEISTRTIKKVPALRGRTIVNLFFETSTRTRTSFEIAGKRLSADVINMSTVPEVNLAREMKIHYASTAMSTDYDCWHEEEEPVTWEMILETMKNNSDSVIKLFLDVIPRIKEYNDVCVS